MSARASILWVGLTLFAGSLALTGCPKVDPGIDDAGGAWFCEVREDCEGGQVCQVDFCADCKTSGQCRLKEVCRIDPEAQTQRCGLRDGWGADCEYNPDCSAGQWCVQGLCKDASLVQTCPSGQKEECPSRMRCNAVNLVCEEDLGCSATSDCSPGEVCNVGAHACVPRCTLETAAQVCLAGEKCVNELCVQCERDADCGVGLHCDAAFRCALEDHCYQDRDCNVPLVCYQPTGQCVTKPPACVSDENCAADQRCNLGTGRCIPRQCQPDRFEPNDELSTARQVAVNTTHAELTLCEGDVDYFAFSLSRGDRLGVNVEADPFSEFTFTTLVQDSSGRTLAAGRLLTSHVAATADLYFVVISTSDLYQPYDVRFLLARGTPCDDDGWEPNDLPAQATPLHGEGQVDGAICPQDKDHFSLLVPAGKGLGAQLVGYDSSGGLLRLCAFVGGATLGCSDDLGTPRLLVPPEEVGGQAVLLRVSGADERSANTYTLAVEFQ